MGRVAAALQYVRVERTACLPAPPVAHPAAAVLTWLFCCPSAPTPLPNPLPPALLADPSKTVDITSADKLDVDFTYR